MNKLHIEIIKVIAYLVVGLFLTAYMFNHIDPWAGIVVGLIFVVIIINNLKQYKNEKD